MILMCYDLQVTFRKTLFQLALEFFLNKMTLNFFRISFGCFASMRYKTTDTVSYFRNHSLVSIEYKSHFLSLISTETLNRDSDEAAGLFWLFLIYRQYGQIDNRVQGGTTTDRDCCPCVVVWLLKVLMRTIDYVFGGWGAKGIMFVAKTTIYEEISSMEGNLWYSSGEREETHGKRETGPSQYGKFYGENFISRFLSAVFSSRD